MMPALDDLRRGLELLDEFEDIVERLEQPGSSWGVLTPAGEEMCRGAIGNARTVFLNSMKYLERQVKSRYEVVYGHLGGHGGQRG